MDAMQLKQLHLIYSLETLFFSFRYSFLSEADQTPEPNSAGRLCKLKTFIRLIGSRNHDLLACIIDLKTDIATLGGGSFLPTVGG
jgi:hypothetical protein